MADIREDQLPIEDTLNGARLRAVDQFSGTPVSVNGPLMITDPSTGRVAIGSTEIGDTGYRDFQSLLQQTWETEVPNAPDLCYGRRVGDAIEVYLQVTTTGGHSSGETVLILPEWCRPRSTVYGSGAAVYTEASFGITFQDGRVNLYQNIGAGQGWRGLLTFMTNRAWPTVITEPLF